MKDRIQFDGEKILFWRDNSTDQFATALKTALPIFSHWLLSRGDDPKDFVRNDIPYEDMNDVARALQLRTTMNPTGGDYGMAYMGWANCRICNAKLGTRDMFGHGFVWPELADHYITHHKVWTPGCDKLLAAIRKAGARR